jgi:hypothetical protein
LERAIVKAPAIGKSQDLAGSHYGYGEEEQKKKVKVSFHKMRFN